MDISVQYPKRSDYVYKSYSGLALCVKQIEYSVEHRAEGDCQIDDGRKDKSSCQQLSAAASVGYEAVDEA